MYVLHCYIATGVGNIKTAVQGCGTVKLLTECDGQTYILKLENILYPPSNCNSLLLLDQWNVAGSSYTSDNGILSLEKGGKRIARGQIMRNNLCKLKVQVCLLENGRGGNDTTLVFVVVASTSSWETWH